jgi:hypothetical protein
MPEQKESLTKYIVVAATGLVSLIVGVSSGLLLDVFRERAPDLTYEIANSDDFAGQAERVGIAVVTVSNAGRSEADDLFCRLTFPMATIKEYKTVGLSAARSETQRTDRSLDLKLPYLNPQEEFTVQLLLSPEAGGSARPQVQLRGKGTVGHQKSQAKGDQSPSILTLSVTAVATTVPIFLMLGLRLYRRVFPRTGFTTQHRDDQRDVTAYVLGSCGMMADASRIRQIPRETPFWSLADDLTEHWLETQDPELNRSGKAAHQRLIEYAHMHETSVWLIEIDIARLAASVGETDIAKKNLREAMRPGHRVISRRVSYDSALDAISGDSQMERL